MMASTIVLGGDAGAEFALDADQHGLGFFCSRHWVAITCSTSEVPMPCARQAKAPWVEVWVAADDGHARQRGAVLGPMTWTMPWTAS